MVDTKNVNGEAASDPKGADQSIEHTIGPSVDNQVFIPAVVVVVLISLFLILFPEIAAPSFGAAKDFVTNIFGWLFLLTTFVAFLFALWLAFGPYGQVKLGSRDEAPEYSTIHWVAMMFTCGVGAGVIVWGFAEPLYYLQDPPLEIAKGSQLAVEFAHMYPLYHWGMTSWALYAVPAVPIAYLLYVRRLPVLRVSTACEDSLPIRGRDSLKLLIDILIIFGIIGGTATALGLGIPLVSALLAEFLGVEDNLIIKFAMLAIWVLIFSFSVYRGLKRGIKILADINLVLAFIAIAFIFIVGPTLYILEISVNSIGVFLDNIFRISLWTEPSNTTRFPESWTVFYWTWYLAFTAFVGLFIARISRGRTIKQLVIGVLVWGTFGTSIFLMVMGGYALHLETTGAMATLEILNEQKQFVLTAKILAALPFGKIVLLLFLILATVFYATNVDSAAYVLSSISSKDLRGDQEPPRGNRLIWALLLALITAGLIITGEIETIQAATIVSALPLLPIILLMSLSLLKWLKQDFGDQTQSKVLTLADKPQ